MAPDGDVKRMNTPAICSAAQFAAPCMQSSWPSQIVWPCCRESTGQTEQTGNVPASAARLSAQPRPLGTSGAGQQPGRPRIVEMAADGSPDESAGAPSGRALGTIAAEARPLGRSARGVSSRSLLAPRLAASVGAMSVNPGTADQQHRHHKPVIEELS